MIILGVAIVVFSVFPYLRDEALYKFMQLKGQTYEISDSIDTQSVFAKYLTSRPISVKPVNTDFALIIEKIGVNAPVVSDVSVTDEESYRNALKEGVAHASSSFYPSTDPGNVYIFAHSSLNFWELGKYAQAFNLLRKLEIGDSIHLYYESQDFVYKVVNKEVLDGFNTYPITRPVIEPLLTLQTCDPPGTTLNRLVITAKLVEVR